MATVTITATSNTDGTFTITSTGLKIVVPAPVITFGDNQDEWERQLSNYVVGTLYP